MCSVFMSSFQCSYFQFVVAHLLLLKFNILEKYNFSPDSDKTTFSLEKATFWRMSFTDSRC